MKPTPRIEGLDGQYSQMTDKTPINQRMNATEWLALLLLSIL